MPGTSTILGHRPILEALQRDIEIDNVSHAYLFEGPKHVGKFTVAKWFAEKLLSAELGPDEQKDVHRQVSRLIHSDLLVLDKLWMEDISEDMDEIGKYSNISQEHRKKAKAKTDTISIDDIRAVQDRLYEVAGGRRCCLIRSVERMQAEAVNALLKILEEPPQGLTFILTTESLPSLLPTLLSRSRLLRFTRLRNEEMEPMLKGVPEDDASFLLQLAQGTPGTVRRLLDDPDLLRKERTLYMQAMSVWHSHSLAERLKLLAPLTEKGTAPDRFLLHLSIALREEILVPHPEKSEPFFKLLRGMETNVNKQLLAQQFAMALS